MWRRTGSIILCAMETRELIPPASFAGRILHMCNNNIDRVRFRVDLFIVRRTGCTENNYRIIFLYIWVWICKTSVEKRTQNRNHRVFRKRFRTEKRRKSTRSSLTTAIFRLVAIFARDANWSCQFPGRFPCRRQRTTYSMTKKKKSKISTIDFPYGKCTPRGPHKRHSSFRDTLYTHKWRNEKKKQHVTMTVFSEGFRLRMLSGVQLFAAVRNTINTVLRNNKASDHDDGVLRTFNTLFLGSNTILIFSFYYVRVHLVLWRFFKNAFWSPPPPTKRHYTRFTPYTRALDERKSTELPGSRRVDRHDTRPPGRR